jgi:hypothetical protein
VTTPTPEEQAKALASLQALYDRRDAIDAQSRGIDWGWDKPLPDQYDDEAWAERRAEGDRLCREAAALIISRRALNEEITRRTR